MKRSRVPVGKKETVVGGVILAVLFLTAIAIYRIQDDLNPAVLTAGRIAERAAVPQTPASPSVVPHPPGMEAMGPLEVFTPATLSDKIDGKAELYLSAGFQRLECRRFRPDGTDGLWVAFCAYDMESPRNAYAVYSAQRREDGVASPVAADAYRTPNALFLVHGSHYVEIIASTVSDAAEATLRRFGEAFVGRTAAEAAAIGERELFPKEGLVPGSIVLQSRDVFGFQRLDNVFTARYRAGDQQLTAFISRRGSADEAREMAAAFSDFLLAFGGRPLAFSQTLPGGWGVVIMDTYEVFFTHESLFAGVHEAEAIAPAVELAKRLRQRLEETAHGK